MQPQARSVLRLTALATLAGCLGTLVPATPAHAQGTTCPCTIWSGTATPGTPAVTDNQPIEIGVKFRSDVDGFVTAIRFYKGSLNTGTHVGHLWSSTGTLLAEATFTGETASGWQEMSLSPAVAITANTTYIASYHSDGYFAFDNGFFSAAGVDNAPLHALRAGVDGANGVFKYGASAFPDGGGSNNYWIDVVFATSVGPDVTPPTVTQQIPASGATGVGLASSVRAIFSEALDATTVSAATFELRDPASQLVSAAAVSYDAASRAAVLTTTAGLLANATYTATLKGGGSGSVIRDRAGNALASDVVWSFTTGSPAAPTDDGPGGPILVVSSSSNPFGRYYAEILRTEGLNAFTATDISLVTPSILAAHDVVILGEMPLTSTQVSMLSAYVAAGGNLIAMRPDKQLASLLGLTDAASTLANGYVLINTAAAPGAGIVGETIQFHGAADRYTLGGGTTNAVATLYSNASTATTNPAVTVASVGSSGGHAAAFTFDLARSIVYTRQGNPAWSGQERDGVTVIRSDDLFFGNAASDPQPDWVDLAKVAIPQADEQQRLLANLVEYLNAARKPLPRFWYLPRGLKAVMVMTGDDHGNGGTVGRFDQYKSLSASGCSVDDWACIRSTSYMYNGTPGMTDAVSLGYQQDGFEVALHVTSDCADWTPSSLETDYATQLATFHSLLPSVAVPTTNRTHCIAWSDYVTQPKVELAHGIRFDTNYYYYPPAWIQDRPGLFTGSGMPMRFADLDGTTIDVYQAASQMTDESGQTYPFTSDTLFDRALGPLGYYGVFTANMHTDAATEQPSDAAVASALARGVPIVSARQMLTWLDGRNGSSFGAIAWNSGTGTLTFTIAAAAGANGLTAMVPTTGANGGSLSTLTRDGASVTFTASAIKGINYAFFPASAGSYTATYVVDTNVQVTDTTAADFSAGTLAGPVAISDAGNGEIILTPAVSQDFAGTTLPSDWSATPWNTGGTATVNGSGSLVVDGARAGTIASYTSGRSLEFVATFSGDPFQHVGLADTLESTPWAIFSTLNGGALFARTNSGSTSIDTPLSGGLLGSPHLFRIDWSATAVTYSVDGIVVATHAIPIAGPLRPLASDFNTGAGVLTVDWLRLGPYAPAGSFLSRVFDATTTVNWTTASWTGRTPSDTAIMLAVRTGNTPTPDASWTPFTTICGTTGPIGTTARYAQYRAVLVGSTDAQSTPALQQVTINYSMP